MDGQWIDNRTNQFVVGFEHGYDADGGAQSDICARAAEVSARRNPCGWPKNRKNKLSMQEIDREIRAYRAERSQTVSTSRS